MALDNQHFGKFCNLKQFFSSQTFIHHTSENGWSISELESYTTAPHPAGDTAVLVVFNEQDSFQNVTSDRNRE